MLESDRTLKYLETVVRARPVEHPIVCPNCGGDVRLRDDLYPPGRFVVETLYLCSACLRAFDELAELETR